VSGCTRGPCGCANQPPLDVDYPYEVTELKHEPPAQIPADLERAVSEPAGSGQASPQSPTPTLLSAEDTRVDLEADLWTEYAGTGEQQHNKIVRRSRCVVSLVPRPSHIDR
jgi:hypothetical protein